MPPGVVAWLYVREREKSWPAAFAQQRSCQTSARLPACLIEGFAGALLPQASMASAPRTACGCSRCSRTCAWTAQVGCWAPRWTLNPKPSVRGRGLLHLGPRGAGPGSQEPWDAACQHGDAVGGAVAKEADCTCW